MYYYSYKYDNMIMSIAIASMTVIWKLMSHHNINHFATSIKLISLINIVQSEKMVARYKSQMFCG